MSQIANNKVAFCMECLSVLTPFKDRFCTDQCHAKHTKRQEERPERRKNWIYLNKNMLDILKSNGAMPHEISFFFYTGNELVGIAVYDEQDIEEKVGDHEAIAYDAWMRPIAHSDQTLEPHDGEQMREEGLLSYLCDNFGIRTEKNVANAIGTLADIEGFQSPVSFINSL